MTREELYDAAHRQPFQPFRITLATGATYDVRHPNLIMVGQRSAMIGLTHDPDGTAYDRTVPFDLVQVVRIETLPATSPSGNDPAT